MELVLREFDGRHRALLGRCGRRYAVAVIAAAARNRNIGGPIQVCLPMSTRLLDSLMAQIGGMRHEHTHRRIRATIRDEVAVDSVNAVLVYEPRRLVPQYAVPVADVLGELVPGAPQPADTETGFVLSDPALQGLPVLDPSIPFAVHTAAGRPADLAFNGTVREHAGYLPDDPDLEGVVILDFAAFDGWFEENDRVHVHARDPYNGIAILPSSREVRIELGGTVIASSRRARLLYEGVLLPMRAYVPREDVLVDLLPSPTRTQCGRKGEASYWSVEVGGERYADVAWTYVAPLRQVSDIAGLVAFFNERVDVVLGGEALANAVTPWSARAA
jgi:uncharacterized protein (DUF427 family)